jgi:predicted methyltransferase
MLKSLLAVAAVSFSLLAGAAPMPDDRFDEALKHAGRPADDLKRDAIDHPDVLLRLTGMKPGAVVADVLGADGYFSELSSYIVGPQGKVLLINNQAFEGFSPDLPKRLEGNRLPNVVKQTVELDDMHLAPDSLDVVLLVKVYHDLYWVDSTGKWPKINVGSVLDQLHRALKRGGVLLLVDHSAVRGHGKNDAGSLHRVEQKFALKDFRAHGFRQVDQSEVLRRPDDPKDQITYKGPMVGQTDRFVLLLRK